MLGFVIVVLACSGSNCSLIQPEPENAYPNFEACSEALGSKSAALGEFAAAHRIAGRESNLVCLLAQQTIVEVEDKYDVLETVIVHSEPSANGGYVGVAENGQRVIVTGEVGGTAWLRVILRDGKSGFVYGDRMRRVGGPRVPVVATAPASPAPAPPPPTPTPQPPVAALPPASPPVTVITPPPPPPPPPQEAAVTTSPPATPSPVTTPPQAAAQPALRPGEFRSCDSLCPTMVTVAAGTFAMGSNDDPTEKPIHRVTLRGFALGKFPVTMAEWNACVAAGGCAYKPASPADADAARTAMTNLSWSDAVEYAQWLQKTTGKNYRLPSEAEWEYAARAGTTTRYWWGEQAGTGHADCEGCGGPRNAPRPLAVDAFAANPWGLHVMGGGVAQWTDDCWHLSYLSNQGAPADGAPWRLANCTRHVLRGGSWKNPASEITVSNRNFYDTNVRYIANGMRVALSLP